MPFTFSFAFISSCGVTEYITNSEDSAPELNSDLDLELKSAEDENFLENQNINDEINMGNNLLKSYQENKSNKDLRRTGLVTVFTGIGLAAFGEYGLSLDVLFGVGLLVMFIGIGQMIAGYVYPNQPDEITDVVESYEKK